MKRQARKTLSLVLLVAVTGWGTTTGSTNDEAVRQPRQAVAQWVKELGNDSFIQRDFAGRQLIRLGAVAIEPLVETARGQDDTAASAAIEVLRHLALNDLDDVGTAAHRGLAQLSTTDTPVMASRQPRIAEALQLSERRVACIVSALEGHIERDDSLAIVGLEVHNDRFTDQHAAMLPRLTQLRRLDLRDCHITDASTKAISQLADLQELNLSDTDVTASGLQPLTALPSLTTLSIYRISLSPDERQQLQSELPDCDIR